MFDAQAIHAQAQENAPQMDRTPIQPGWYKVTIAKYERMMNKNGSGEHLKIEFDLENRRKVWNRYNLRNTNEKAERIALEQIAALCMACGFNSIRDVWDPVELMGKQCELYIDVDGTYNNVKSARKLDAINTALRAEAQRQVPTTPAEVDTSNIDDSIPF